MTDSQAQDAQTQNVVFDKKGKFIPIDNLQKTKKNNSQ